MHILELSKASALKFKVTEQTMYIVQQNTNNIKMKINHDIKSTSFLSR